MMDIPPSAADASPLEQADVAVAQAMAPIHDTLPVRTLGLLSELADQPPMIALNSAVLTIGLLAGDRRLARAGVRMLTAHLLATGMKVLVKRQIDRTRPFVLVEEGRYAMSPGHDRDKKVNSFPSGHTAGAVATARAFARDYPGQTTPAMALAGAAALVQIPRCAHYPSDIAAGAAIGLIAEQAVSALGGPLFDLVGNAADRQAERLAAL